MVKAKVEQVFTCTLELDYNEAVAVLNALKEYKNRFGGEALEALNDMVAELGDQLSERNLRE